MENDFRANVNDLKELIALRDRICTQSECISCILRDVNRMIKYREILMQYRAQINALIDRKEEEPTFGIGTLSDENFIRYFSNLSFHLQDVESEILEFSQPKVRINLHFDTDQGKAKKLPILQKSLHTSSPSSPSKHQGSVRLSINRSPKSASPLKMLMQGLFRANAINER